MKVLMVCLGNICRSPLAQGILEQKILERQLGWTVDSAGTSGWHIGEKPDSRAIKTAADKGLNISNQRSRQILPEDLHNFDLILAMDQSNYNNIRQLSQNKSDLNKIKLILNYVYPGENRPVPDPYYDDSFDRVFNLLDSAADKIIEVHNKNDT